MACACALGVRRTWLTPSWPQQRPPRGVGTQRVKMRGDDSAKGRPLPGYLSGTCFRAVRRRRPGWRSSLHFLFYKGQKVHLTVGSRPGRCLSFQHFELWCSICIAIK